MTATATPTVPREQSAAAPSPFPPIAEYAFLSNCHTGALVAPDGAIDWLCVPRFDAPSVFGSLLDREAGFFRFGPFGINHPTSRYYEPGTNVLVTTWRTPSGWIVVRDALTMGPWDHEDKITPHTRPPADDDAEHALVRTVECVEGRVEVEVVCEPVFDYGRTPAEWTMADGSRHAADASGAGVTVRLRSDLPLGIEGNRVRGRHVLNAGERAFCSLSWAEELASPNGVDEAFTRVATTTRFWRNWLDGARVPDHRWREPLQRSALAIKGLTYMPTGATIAALTTSLPETPGGERNWDYRYTWMRDTTFTLQALHYLNLDWEADEFMQFVADLQANDDGGLQIMYGIDGRRDLTESMRDDLTGYAGARPVRIGNGAFDQRQNDVFGAVLDSILLHTRRSKRLPRRLWPIVQAQAECATAVWRNPDQGIWEARGEPQHYVSSKLMSWVALDRAAFLAHVRGDPQLQAKWAATAEEVRQDILDHGVDDRGVLRQHYATDSLDASTLLAALFDFLPPEDKRLRATVLAIADELTEDGFVLRYRTDETDDGLSGERGDVPHLLVLARVGARDHRRVPARDRPDGEAASDRIAARPLCRGVRRRDEPTPRQLPAGVLAPRADGSRSANHPRRDAGGDLMEHYDVIIVGTGAGGGTLARHLASSGKRILLLERGDWLPREPENWLAQNVFVENRYVSPDTWYDASGKPFQPQIHYFVGGATKLYGAALYRLRAEDFGELRHHDGISPAWPVTYEELEPYYTLAEQLYEVHGSHGEDPTDPPASKDYPYPPVSHEPRIQQLSDDLAAAGYHPFHAPCGIRLSEANMPYSACVRCMNCDGFPCAVHGKSDADVLGVRPALEHSNVTLLTNAKAVKLETNSAGTAVTDVVVEQNGSTERFAGDVVVLACGAANTAKLLLESASDRHPNGLANGSDQVGRNYMFHNSAAVLALSREENNTIFQKTLGLNDFYLGGNGFEYPLGNIQMVGKSQSPMFRGEKPGETKFAPEWSLDRVAKHAIDFWLSTEDLPRPENRVTVDREGRLTLSYTPTNEVPKKKLYEKLHSMLGKLDLNPGHLIHRFAYMKNDIPVAGVAHQAGTVRFGTDPATSALDRECKAHELDNLYVADTSVFPSIGAVNPALTAMANALRVGDHLLERMA